MLRRFHDVTLTGGFNNRIPTTISQACYRNPHVGFFLLFLIRVLYASSLAYDERRRRSRSDPTDDALCFPRQSRAQILSRIIPTCWRNMAACNLGFNVTIRRSRGRGSFCKGSNARKYAWSAMRAFCIPISVRNCRRTLCRFDSHPTCCVYVCWKIITRARELVRTNSMLFICLTRSGRILGKEFFFIKEANARFSFSTFL